ncbi:hypothetical protein [Roseibium sp. M-1]
MPKKKAQKPVRELVRETFTPSRVGILSWAFAAVLMGTVGLASYQFGNTDRGFTPPGPGSAGLLLPPAGGVETTASISTGSGRGVPVEVMRLPEADGEGFEADLSQSQIEVLQKELVGLRRRLSALSEQNLAYSRRIAALEKEVALTKLSSSGRPAAEPEAAAEPGAGVVITRTPPSPAMPEPPIEPDTSGPTGTPPKSQDHSAVFTLPKPKSTVSSAPVMPQVPPRLINLHRDTVAATSAADLNPNDPVRIVALSQREVPKANIAEVNQAQVALPPVVLPEAAGIPLATGSIPATAADTIPGNFEPTPTEASQRPAVVTPSSPAGRLRGGGDRQLKRSDFGAIIGHYTSTAAAAKAWADFKNQNVERMRDLQPLLMQRSGAENGIALMVGPFANAADAAVACLQLLDVTELCHPALYAGDPLVTAADFRDTAF